MLDMKNWTLNAHTVTDGSKIRVAQYNRNQDIEKYIIFLNGHGEFLEKYAYLPEDLRIPSHYGFLSWDHRGQGASDGAPRLHIDDYDIFARDAGDIVQHYVGTKPYSVVAHSMGGLITLFATMKSYMTPDKILISAPLLGIQHFIPDWIARSLSQLITRLGWGKAYFQEHLQLDKKFKKNMFTHSKEHFENRFKSPYKIEGITFGWIDATFRALETVTDPTHLRNYKTPTKILYGDDERLVSTKAIQHWVKNAGPHTSCIELKNTRHELFAEAPESYNTVLQLTRDFLALDKK